MNNIIARKARGSMYLLAVIMAMLMVCATGKKAYAASVVASGNCGAEGHESDVTWTLDDEGVLTISGTGAMRDYSDLSFSHAPWYGTYTDFTGAIKTITINSGVTSIGSWAFQNCSALTSITIPDGVTSIGEGAFADCRSLTSITIPDSVTSIGSWAFRNCSALTSITIPDGVTSIGMVTFYCCSALTSITIPNSVTSIGSWAFQDCSALTSITIPDSVTSIEWYAFCDCSNLKNIYYSGTKEEWDRISIGNGNDPINNAQISFNVNIPTDNLPSKDYTGFVPDESGTAFWYENGVKQGVKLKADGTPDKSYRGKEIYDPESKEWYWLDNIQYGAIARSKDVYQESKADDEGNIGKWVRYDENGHMVKGWDTDEKGSYYFDPTYGTMLKGDHTIDGVTYHFNEGSGIMTYCSISLENHWETIDGNEYWYENGQRQGKDDAHKDYRGKEIYDSVSDAWYWLDNVDGGKKAVSKDVYQVSEAGEWGDINGADGKKYGKWVRYDANGHMIKGWCSGKDADAKAIASPAEAGDANVYYFEPIFGTMAKGKAIIDGTEYEFDPTTGILKK